jgi:hypothetical protein
VPSNAGGRRLTEERRLQVNDFEELNIESLADTDSNFGENSSYDEVDFISIFIYNQADEDVDADFAPRTENGEYVCSATPTADDLACTEHVMIKVGSTWHMIINLAVGQYTFLASAIDEEALDDLAGQGATEEKEIYKGIVRNKEVIVNRRTSILLTLFQVDDFVQVVGNSLPLVSEMSLDIQTATPNADRSNDVTLTITGSDLDEGDSMYVSIDAVSSISSDHTYSVFSGTTDGTVITTQDGNIDVLGDGFGFEETWFELTKDGNGQGTATVTWAVGLGGCQQGYDQWRIQFDAYITDEVQGDPSTEDSLRTSAAQITGPITLDLLVDCEAGQLELDVEFNTAPEFIALSTDSRTECEGETCVSPYFEGITPPAGAGTADDPTSSLYDNNGWHEYLIQAFVYDDEGDATHQNWAVTESDDSEQTQFGCTLFGTWEADGVAGDYARRAEESDYDAGQVIGGIDFTSIPPSGSASDDLAGGKVVFYKPTYEVISVLDANERGFNPTTSKSSQFVYIDHWECPPGEICMCELTNTVERIELDANGDAINQADLFVTQQTTATITYQYSACATTKVNAAGQTVCFQQNYRPMIQDQYFQGDGMDEIDGTSVFAVRATELEYDLSSTVRVSLYGEGASDAALAEFHLSGYDGTCDVSEVTGSTADGSYTVTMNYITTGDGLDTSSLTSNGLFEDDIPTLRNWRALEAGECFGSTNDEGMSTFHFETSNTGGLDVARIEVSICNERAVIVADSAASVLDGSVEFDEQCKTVVFTDGSGDLYCEYEDTVLEWDQTGEFEVVMSDNVTIDCYNTAEGALEVGCGATIHIDDTSNKLSRAGGKSGDLLFYWGDDAAKVLISTCSENTDIDTIIRVYDGSDRNCPYNPADPSPATVTSLNDDQTCISQDGQVHEISSMLVHDFTAATDDQDGAFILVEGFGENRIDGSVSVTFTCIEETDTTLPTGAAVPDTLQPGLLSNVGTAGYTVRVMGNTWLDGVIDFSTFDGSDSTTHVTGSGFAYDATVTEEFLAVHAHYPGVASGGEYVYMDSVGFFKQTIQDEASLVETSTSITYGGEAATCTITQYCDATEGGGFNGDSLLQITVSTGSGGTSASCANVVPANLECSTVALTNGGDMFLAAVAIEGGVCQEFNTDEERQELCEDVMANMFTPQRRFLRSN